MLANRQTSQMYERDRFIKVAEDMGINFTVVFADEVDLLVSRDDRRSIRYRGEATELPDMCLARTGSSTGFYNLSVLRQLERLHVLTLPNSTAIESSKDKFYSNQILAQAGLPIPKTMLARFPVSQDLVEKQIGLPCVIKVVTGSHGAGVYLCETLKQFLDLNDSCHDRSRNTFHQPQRRNTDRGWCQVRSIHHCGALTGHVLQSGRGLTDRDGS
jgi:gamma-F420-2:alpha-L-glutamate ligase